MKEEMMYFLGFVVICLCLTALAIVPIVESYKLKSEYVTRGYVQQPVKYEVVYGTIWVKPGDIT